MTGVVLTAFQEHSLMAFESRRPITPDKRQSIVGKSTQIEQLLVQFFTDNDLKPLGGGAYKIVEILRSRNYQGLINGAPEPWASAIVFVIARGYQIHDKTTINKLREINIIRYFEVSVGAHRNRHRQLLEFFEAPDDEELICRLETIRWTRKA